MIEKVIRYKCSHCKTLYVSKSYANKHEKKCYKNPESKSCITCEHLEIIPYTRVKENTHVSSIFGTTGRWIMSTDQEIEDGDFAMQNHCAIRECKLSPLMTNCKHYKQS